MANDSDEAYAQYVSDYLDFVENDPDDIQKKFVSRILELNVTLQTLFDEVDVIRSAFSDTSKNPAALNMHLTQLMIQVQEVLDMKLSLTQGMQDFVENRQKQLDEQLENLDIDKENEMEQLNNMSDYSESSSKRSNRRCNSEKEVTQCEKKEVETPVACTSKKHKKTKQKPKETTVTVTTEELVDPDEPRYCVCNQIFYGQMICCDNKDCAIQWFHFPCVKVLTKPKGKWYCPDCRGDRSNQPKMS